MTEPAPHTLYQILKDFQPAMAAVIALIAATFAYRGAMAKVQFDDKEAKRRRAAEELALFQRLRAALLPIADTADHGVEKIQEVLKPTDQQLLPMVKRSELRLQIPGEISEAWVRLDLFSEDTIYDLSRLRQLMTRLETVLPNMEDDYIWTFDEENPEEAFLIKVREILTEIAKLCRRVRKDLKLSVSTARKSGFSYPIAETHRSASRESWGD